MSELKRLVQATRNSMAGLGFAIRDEQAFRSQLIVLAVLIPAAIWLASSTLELLALLASALLVLITELLNTAVEAVVDRASPDIHPLAKKAKDCGSAAVFVAMMLTLLVWGLLLWDKFAGPLWVSYSPT
ncbi:MAG: diacylglycerol kinase [Pseudomonadota bacterium]